MSNNLPQKSFFMPCMIRAWQWTQIWCHVISGLLTIASRFPFANSESKNQLIQVWSIRLLNIFGIQLKVVGGGMLPTTPFLLAANHISWMDIHAINAFSPILFVAKSDVESWPIFGWMAKQLGTVFIKRDNARHGKQVAGVIATVLKRESVCIFPEGTSTIGDGVLPFKPNLFEAAVIADVPVYSLAVCYTSPLTGMRSEAPAFVGEMGLLESMGNILRCPGLIVELTFLPPSGASPSTSRDRKWLALHSQEAISTRLKGVQPTM